MVTYIKQIIWKFVKYEPVQFKLLDVRHSVMKNLILGDCDQLIRFILFGDEDDNQKKKFITRHTPRNALWNKNREFGKDDDFKLFENKDDESKRYNNK